MKIILLNIKSFFRNQKLVFIVVLLCVLISSFVLNFSFGLYKNFIAQKNNAIKENKEIAINIANNSELKKDDFEAFFKNLDKSITDNTKLCYVKYDTKRFDIEAVSRFSLKDGKYSCPESLREYYNRNNIKSGQYFSDDDENSKEKIIISYNNFDKDGQIKLWGESYKVIAVQDVQQNYEVPFNSVPDDVCLKQYILWYFYDSMDKGTYDLIKETADEYIPGCLEFPDISLPDYDSIKVYNNIAAAAIIISILSAINLAMLFGFIMQKRKKTFTIFRITGCTRKKVIAYYLAECFSLIIPSYLVGTIAFEIVLKTILRKFYKYMSGVYSIKVYILIFAIYLVISVISIIIVTLKSVNKSINEEWRSN